MGAGVACVTCAFFCTSGPFWDSRMGELGLVEDGGSVGLEWHCCGGRRGLNNRLVQTNEVGGGRNRERLWREFSKRMSDDAVSKCCVPEFGQGSMVTVHLYGCEYHLCQKVKPESDQEIVVCH